MVPWSHWRQPFSGWMLTVLTSEFTHFNLVIRLSKAKQSAFRLCTFFGDSRCSGCPLRPFVKRIPYRMKPFRTARNFIFYYCSPRFWSSTWHVRQQATGMSFSCRYGLFGFWWGETYCAPNSLELESRFCLLWLTWTRAWIGTTHDF